MGIKDVKKLFQHTFNDLIGKRGSYGVFLGVIAILEMPFLIFMALIGGIYFDD